MYWFDYPAKDGISILQSWQWQGWNNQTPEYYHDTMAANILYYRDRNIWRYNQCTFDIKTETKYLNPQAISYFNRLGSIEQLQRVVNAVVKSLDAAFPGWESLAKELDKIGHKIRIASSFQEIYPNFNEYIKYKNAEAKALEFHNRYRR